jgi:hypothetical protein
MKRVLRVILALAFILAFILFVFFLAKRSRANLEAALPLAARTVLIAPSSQPESSRNYNPESPAPRAKILLLWDEVLLDAIDMNLDEDLELEQVLVVRDHSSETGIISIVIADFSSSAGSYFRVWKGESLATKPNVFVVQPRDLVGDGKIDLLCFGLDEKNLQTLTVFRPSLSPTGVDYIKVFSGSALAIRVEEEIDAQQEENVFNPPATPLISVFASAGNEASPLDQIRLVYAWDRESASFVLKSQEPIPSEKLERSFIESVLTGQPEEFESYIEGLWRKDGSPDAEPTLVYFAPDARTIAIYSKTEKQLWDWGRSNSSYAGIYTSIVNSGVPDMVRILGVDLLGRDRIRLMATPGQAVKFPIREDWNGTYGRVQGRSAEAAGSLKSLVVESSLNLPLEGSSEKILVELSSTALEFKAQNGFALRLAQGKFSYQEGQLGYQGVYPLFSYGNHLVLDFEVQDSRKIPAGRRSYFISLRDEDSKNRQIILKPVKISSQGIEDHYKPALVFSGSIEDQGNR